MDKSKLMSILKGFNCNPPATERSIEKFKKTCTFTIPQDYLEFMKISNGGEGGIGQNAYAIFWKLTELAQFNKDYEVQAYAPELFLFGSDGGGEAFAFDTRQTPASIAMIPFVGMELESAQEVGRTFWDFLEYLYHLD